MLYQKNFWKEIMNLAHLERDGPIVRQKPYENTIKI